jgi:hypothetical protein
MINVPLPGITSTVNKIAMKVAQLDILPPDMVDRVIISPKDTSPASEVKTIRRHLAEGQTKPISSQDDQKYYIGLYAS